MADLGDFSRSESLVERKRRQWAQEKAELQEWYPFGKPGAGAPLKSPLTTMDQSSKCTSQVSANADPSPYAYYHCTAGQTRLMPTNAVPLNCAIPCSSSTPCRTLSIGTAGPCTHGGAYQGWSPINIEMDRVNGMAPPATAYVSPMVFGQQLPQASSNSPSGCDVRSLCSGDGVDCSLLTMHEQAISKSYPGMSDDFGIHKRRAMVTAPKNECDLEEQRARTIQQMKAIDEQIQEKRRKMLEEAERGRETERIERERQQIELREAMQRKVERSKWKRLQLSTTDNFRWNGL